MLEFIIHVRNNIKEFVKINYKLIIINDINFYDFP